MPRAKRGFKRRRRVKKVYQRTEGFVLGWNKIYRRAKEAVNRSMRYAYRDRRVKKRDFRGLWIERLSAASALHDISYSRLISALSKSNVALNRKMLSEIAIHDPSGFGLIVDQVRSASPAH